MSSFTENPDVNVYDVFVQYSVEGLCHEETNFLDILTHKRSFPYAN